MSRTQNGWPVVGANACDTRPLVRNVTVPNGVLAGDVAVIARWHAGQYDRRVERLKKGTCWGWVVKKIKGSAVRSNHGSATAWDLNAPDNPMGEGTTKKSMTPAQIQQCHQLEDESDDVLRWGGDYVTRQDPMHWEVVGSRAAVRQLAAKIRHAAAGGTAKPAVRKPTMKMTVAMPVLREGDDDAQLDGFNMITRIQRIVGADDDGVWGPDTTKQIAAWCKIPVQDARVLSEAVARKVFGLAAAA